MWARAKERERTFRERLTLWTTALCLGSLTLVGAAFWVGALRALQLNLDRALLSIARTEVASALDGSHRQVHIHGGDPLFLELPEGGGYQEFAQIEDARGTVIVRTHNLENCPCLETTARDRSAALSGRVVFSNITRGDGVYRAVYYPMRDRQRHSLAAVVAIPTAPMWESLDSLTLVLTISLLLVGGGAAWACQVLAQQLARPLHQIAQAVQGVGESNLGIRIPEVSRDAEIRRVTGLLNQMLGQLQEAFTSQQQVIEAHRRFVADASHEMRTPLSNLRGTVEVALRRPRSTEEYQETLNVCLKEIRRLGGLVEDLLLLSRTDAGQFSLRPEPCDLCEVAEGAARLRQAAAERAGITLHVDCRGPLGVAGDRNRLIQAVGNLLDNALHHAPWDSVVTISGTRQGNEACLEVQDQGPGLSAEQQAHVFDRFYRADPARARRSGGMGLGLAIAQALAEAHGGRITVQSQPGAGATFTLHLPPEMRNTG